MAGAKRQRKEEVGVINISRRLSHSQASLSLQQGGILCGPGAAIAEVCYFYTSNSHAI